MKPSAPLAFFSTVLAVAAPGAAQEAAHPSIVTAGITAGAMRFKGGLTEDVMTGVLQVQPHPWLTLGVAPTAARIAPPDSTAYSGFGDLPVSLGLTKQFPGGASPAASGAGIRAGRQASGRDSPGSLPRTAPPTPGSATSLCRSVSPSSFRGAPRPRSERRSRSPFPPAPPPAASGAGIRAGGQTSGRGWAP